MKRLKLPHNKVVRLVINIAFIPSWFFIWMVIWRFGIYGLFDQYLTHQIQTNASGVANDPGLITNLLFLVTNPLIAIALPVCVPIFLVTRYIWFGRIRPKRRITTSTDD